MLTIERAVLAAMRTHAEQAYPEECCGVVFSGPGGQLLRRLTNVQNRLHAEEPEAFPRDARTAYHWDSREHYALEAQARQPGWRLHVIYHSHPEHGAYFSPTDRARASFEDPADGGREPVYPDTAWVVLSVYGRRVRDVLAFTWDAGAGDFRMTPFDVIRGPGIDFTFERARRRPPRPRPPWFTVPRPAAWRGSRRCG